MFWFPRGSLLPPAVGSSGGSLVPSPDTSLQCRRALCTPRWMGESKLEQALQEAAWDRPRGAQLLVLCSLILVVVVGVQPHGLLSPPPLLAMAARCAQVCLGGWGRLPLKASQPPDLKAASMAAPR